MPKKIQIEDTSRRNPRKLADVLNRAGSDESTKYITDMEKAGQQALVKSDQIPRETNGCQPEDLTALGFKLLPPEGDPLFRPAVLPEGWTKEASSHDMWSYIRDANGFRRVAVFYKAAFYDRRAFLSLERRFHAEKDYDAEDKDGTLRYQVIAKMPQGDGKVMASFEADQKFPEDKKSRHEPRPPEYWTKEQELRKLAEEWIKANFPDPTTHWDPKL